MTEEFEQTPEITLRHALHPAARAGARVTGGVLLVRDVSELRRRDRLLLSKDATIREIHHRVKNNLQTISSLLRLQGRRLTSPEAKAAIEESVRRIRTIALVHETLSREAGDDVAFVRDRAAAGAHGRGEPAVARPAGALPGRRATAASCPAAVATPLAVVLTELLQNAVDHAFPAGERAGSVVVRAGQRRHDARPCRSSTTASGCPRASRSTRRPGSACRSCARW